MSADERFVLGQRILNEPDKVFEEEIERRLSKRLEAELAPLREMTKAQKEFQAAREFTAQHPDYPSTPKNDKRIEKWLRVEGLEGTVENIEKAYADLSESGLLEARAATKDAGPQQDARIVQRVVGQRRAASGLSSRGSAGTPVAHEPTLDELYSMPYEKLQALALAEAAKANQ
jgi:hypothetical protein